jgi:glutamate dehydrogenase/leucine dehydrogenase
VLFGYREAERISVEAILQAEGDVLVLASSPHEVHSGNWRKVSAPIVVEAVWDGVSPAAKEQLVNAERVVVPWSLATCGTVLGAYLESRGEHPFRSLDQLLQKTQEAVQRTYARVAAYSTAHSISLDDAARQVAVERVAAAIRTCGF